MKTEDLLRTLRHPGGPICTEAADLIERLEEQSDAGWAEVQRLAGERDRLTVAASDLRAEVRRLAAHLHELRELLDRRPAINQGLFEAYQKWSGEVCALDWLNALDTLSIPSQGTAP